VWPAQQLAVAEFQAKSATRRHKRRVLLGVVRARRQLRALVASLAPGAAPNTEA
jgi:predicted hotdog family 3-hydroxylacyl-ACP dehydratase